MGNVGRIDMISRGRCGPPRGIVVPDTLGSMRRVICQLTYLAYGTRPHLAAWAGKFPAKVTYPSYRYVSATNDLEKLARQPAGKFGYCVKNDPRLDKLHLVSFADCAFSGDDGGSCSGPGESYRFSRGRSRPAGVPNYRGRPPPGLLPPAGPRLALRGPRGAKSGRQGVAATF